MTEVTAVHEGARLVRPPTPEEWRRIRLARERLTLVAARTDRSRRRTELGCLGARAEAFVGAPVGR